MKNKRTLILIVSILVGLGVGFGGGYFVRGLVASKARSGFAAMGANGVPIGLQRYTGSGTRATGQGVNGSARMGGATEGTILSMDANSITVKMNDGSTKIVLLSGTTTYFNTATASQNELKTGSTVAVIGSSNSDGSVTATSVQINPASFKPQGSPVPTTP